MVGILLLFGILGEVIVFLTEAHEWAEAVWVYERRCPFIPVEVHCKALGQRIRFYHVDPLSGFKSGALDFALERTVDTAQIIAVIDGDYIVDPNWLRDLAPQFMNVDIAVVPVPQDYRDANENAFKAISYTEYRDFFYIGMVTRNERNAIIQHGTMTMVRRNVLEQNGGWSQR